MTTCSDRHSSIKKASSSFFTCSVSAVRTSAPISNPEMCAPSNLQQLGLGQICLCPMNPVVQYWLTPAWKHLHHLTLRKANLLSKGLNNECYSVLASILR